MKEKPTYKGMTIFFYGTERNTFDPVDFDNNLEKIAGLGVNTIVLIPYGFQETISSNHITRDDPRSIPDADFISACNRVVKRGFTLVVKPHVDVNTGDPRADIIPSDRPAWKASYLKFILHYAHLADTLGAHIFCVGTELTALSQDTHLWHEIIDSCRSRFRGLLTYSSCPQEVLSVQFWNKLDYIGANAYFPVSKRNNPMLEDMLFSWASWKEMLRDVSLSHHRDVLLTEIGYMNHTLAAENPGSFEHKGDRDDRLQADCYRAALIASEKMDFLHGMFWWQWELNDRGDTAAIDYTPRGRPAERVVKEYWQ
ncbi:MAG: hypothetical protein GF401_18620 [Chitinivibrionales bacterium]|nr:hypothetical protein [Chitinivibrionales bacterium]